MEYWFKGSTLQSAVRFQDANGYMVAGWGSSGALKHILSNDGGVDNGLSVGAAATDGQWHHVAFTWQQGTANGFKSYLDGQLVAQRNASDTPLPQIQNLILGSYAGISEFMSGTLEEVRVWKVARTQAEIQAGMNCGITPPQANLLLYYKFDHSTAGGSNGSENLLLNSANPGSFTGVLNNFALSGNSSNWVASGVAEAPSPEITHQPLATQTVVLNNPATTLSVTSTGDGLSYQWYSHTQNSNSGGQPIQNATSSSYPPPTATTGTFYYYVVVTNSCGKTVSSTVATVTVEAPACTTPVISSVVTPVDPVAITTPIPLTIHFAEPNISSATIS